MTNSRLVRTPTTAVLLIACISHFATHSHADDAAAAETRVFIGTVVDADGTPIPDALIEWGYFRGEAADRETTTTNEQGEYRLETTRLADFRLGCYKDGYMPRWFDGIIPGRADEPSEFAFQLAPANDLIGVVVGPNGTPLPGVTVEAKTGRIGDTFSSFSSPVVATPFPGPARVATTNEQGEFVIHNVAKSVVATPNDETSVVRVLTDKVQLTLHQGDEWLGQQEFGFDEPVRFEVPASYLPLTAESTGVVRGLVVDAATLEPITNFQIIRRHLTAGEWFESDDGRFTLSEPLRAGREYQVRAFAEGYAPATARILAVSADDHLEVTIGLTRHPSLHCEVVDGLTGEPLPEVHLVCGYYDPTQSWKYVEWSSFASYADGHHQLNDVQHASTDSEGRVVFPEGEIPHSLVIFHPGYARTIVLPQERDSLMTDDGTLRIELAPESRINGHIVMGPIPGTTFGIQVQALSGLQEVDEMYHNEGDANDAGEFTIDRLRGGRYRLSVMLNTSSFGYPIWSTEVDLLDVQELDVELGGPVGPYTLSGQATPFSLIRLSPEAPDATHYFGGYTDADGHCEITGLPAGSYHVTIDINSAVRGTRLDWRDTVQIDGDTELDLSRP